MADGQVTHIRAVGPFRWARARERGNGLSRGWRTMASPRRKSPMTPLSRFERLREKDNLAGRRGAACAWRAEQAARALSFE